MSTSREIYVPIDIEIFADLMSRYGTTDPAKSFRTISDVVRDFLDRTESSSPKTDPVDGLYWQSIFLPNGTHLQIKIRGKQHLAKVFDREVRYEEKTFTPSSWANFVAGHARNAWRDIHVMRPGDTAWILADTIRRNKIR